MSLDSLKPCLEFFLEPMGHSLALPPPELQSERAQSREE
jgi:hypothetical protein